MNKPNIASVTAPSEKSEEIDLMDILAQIFHYRRWIIGSSLLCGGLAMLYALLVKPVFSATTTIMPPQMQSNSANLLLGQLGSLNGVAEGLVKLKSPGDVYIGMLKSRSIADDLVRRFKLEQYYNADSMDAARDSLRGKSGFQLGKDGFISITVNDEDPKLAAKLANAYVEELIELQQSFVITDSAKYRSFVEHQLKQAQQNLAAAELSLRRTQEKTGLIQPERQLPAIVGSVTQLRAHIAAKEVQLAAMRSYATKENPLYVHTSQELEGLRAQLNQLVEGQGKGSDLIVPTGKVAERGLEYLRKLRDVKYSETIFEILSKHYELAKIEEAKDSSMIHVLDAAVPPQQKSKPKRSLIVFLGVLAGFVLGVVIVLSKVAMGRSKAWSRFQCKKFSCA